MKSKKNQKMQKTPKTAKIQRNVNDKPPENAVQKAKRNKAIVCKICNKSFPSASHLCAHNQMHRDDRPYKCTECDLAFKRSGNLRQHQRTHSGERPYECIICGRAFAQLASHITHMRIHTGEKPFSCDVCTKKFRIQSELNKHQRIHSNDRPFTCKVCNKAFLRQAALEDHLRIHTGQKPFKCTICSRLFRTTSEFCTHKKRNPECDFEGSVPMKLIVKGDISIEINQKVSQLNEAIANDSAEEEVVSVAPQKNEIVSNSDLYHWKEITEKEEGNAESLLSEEDYDLQVDDHFWSDSDSSKDDSFTQNTKPFGSTSHQERSNNVGSSIVCGDNALGSQEKHLDMGERADYLLESDTETEESYGISDTNIGYDPEITLQPENVQENNVQTEKEEKSPESQAVFTKPIDYDECMQLPDTGLNTNTQLPIETSKKFPTGCNDEADATQNIGENLSEGDQSELRDGLSDQHSPAEEEKSTDASENSSKPEFICEKCSKVFKSRSSVRAHMYTHGKEKPHKCDQCDKAFRKPQHLVQHIRTHTGQRPFKCTHCDKSFTQQSSQKRHILTHTDQKGLECKDCEKIFDNSSNLLKHQKSVHGTESSLRPYECDKCDMCFVYLWSLIIHQRRIHITQSQIKCDKCEKIFSTPSELKKHYKAHLTISNFICSVCGKVFKRSNNLVDHMRTHTDERPYKCKFCDYTYKSVGARIRHERVHTGEKPFSCKHCDRVFSDQTQWRVHTNRHIDNRSHMCQYCSKSFITAGHLKTHMRAHTNEKRFKCDICSKLYSCKTAYEIHKRFHSGETPYECEVCGKRFRSGSEKLRHVEKQHRKAAVSESKVIVEKMLY